MAQKIQKLPDGTDVIYLEGDTGGLPEARCTCGWKKPHARMLVLAKAAKRHAMKTGHKLREH